MRSLRVHTVPISEVSRAIETAGYSCRMERKVSAETEPIMTSVSAITLAERGAPSMAAYSPKHSPAGMSRKATSLPALRSEERLVGKECVQQCRYRGSPNTYK